MSSIPLLPTHRQPHTTPLRVVDRLDDSRDLVHEGDGAGHVIEYRHFADLLLRECCGEAS